MYQIWCRTIRIQRKKPLENPTFLNRVIVEKHAAGVRMYVNTLQLTEITFFKKFFLIRNQRSKKTFVSTFGKNRPKGGGAPYGTLWHAVHSQKSIHIYARWKDLDE